LSQEQSAAATMAYSRAGGNETLNASNLGLPPVVGRPLGRPSIEKGHEDFNRKWMKGCWHMDSTPLVFHISGCWIYQIEQSKKLH